MAAQGGGLPRLLRARLAVSRLAFDARRPLLAVGVNLLDMVEGPPLVVDAARAAAYDDLLRDAVRGGGRIEYGLPHPRHEFLSYVIRRHGLLAHGSNLHDIEEFEPRPANEAGAIQLGVHAASDGIWPLYFATVARGRGRLVQANGCVHTGSGDRTRRWYFFAISTDPDDPASWTDGTVYLLPSGTFRRHRGQEWLSETPVRPLATLRVTPDDFPFLRSTAQLFWPETPGRIRHRFRRRHERRV